MAEQLIEIAAESGADFAVTMTDELMSPLFPRGARVLFEQRAQLSDGDFGLFLARGKCMLRQYFEDQFGNVYLLVLNRKHEHDNMVLAPDEGLCYFGRAILNK